MKALVFFSDDNTHPLAFLLKRGYGHVWCAVKDEAQDLWLSYDWHVGLPVLRSESVASYDLKTHYEKQDFTCVEFEITDITFTPLVLNNCVGHTKLMLGIGGFALTPWQLFRRITEKKAPIMSKFKRLFTFPGFGGAPKAPAPPPPPPTREDPAVLDAKENERQARLRRAGRASNILTGNQGVLSDAPQSQARASTLGS